MRWSKRQYHLPKPRWSRHHERSTDFTSARHRLGLRAAESGIQPRVTGFFAGFGAW